jgi:hypothetical protein
MILIICAWIYYFLLSLSLGAGLLKILGRISGCSLNAQFSVIYKFWFGFVFLIGILQVISLFLPLSNIAFIIVSLLALLIFLLNFKSASSGLALIYRQCLTLKGFISFGVIMFLLLVVSYSANKDITHPDTFLYHFNAVKWAKDYPVVPGLVNLHNRLGFNSSFFLFAAFTEVGLYENHSAHIALSFLMVACLVHWFLVIANPRELMAKRIFCMMTVVFLLYHIFYRMDIASLSTDYPTAVLTLVFCLILLDRIDHKILLLLPVSAAIFSFKLSGMLAVGLSVTMLAGYLFLAKYGYKDLPAKKAHMRTLIASFALLCFIICGFVIRNVVISGWLLYPFPIGNLHLPWSVSRPYVLDMIDVINSYPKLPEGASAELIRDHNFYFWFVPWFNNFKQSTESLLLTCSVLLLFWSVFQVSSVGRFIYARLNVFLLILFAVASIFFWFFSAPGLRFGSIYFYILFAGAVVLLYEGSAYKHLLKVFIFMVFIYQVAREIPGFYTVAGARLFVFPYTKPEKLNRVVASPRGENPPLYIYMPAEGNKCGNSPLPCTPYAGGLLHSHQLIRQRVPGDISKGFLPPIHQTK